MKVKRKDEQKFTFNRNPINLGSMVPIKNSDNILAFYV